MKNPRILEKIGAILSVICWLIAGSPNGPAVAAGSAEPKKTIAVVEFAVRGSDLDPQAGAIIADSMTSAIASLGYFALKDRLSLSAIARIAKNNPFGSIGPIDAETAMQLGKLYGIHGIVTGTVSRLGDRVRVTARLIDTRTGTVLHSGEIEDRDIDAVQVKLNKLVMAVTTMPVSSSQSWRALTVKTEPVNATVRLLNVGQPYQPGIRLPAGVYDVEVSHPGYVTRKVSARIAENDVTLLINLEKALYALTIDIEPPQSQIYLVNTLNLRRPYRPGMKLEAGVYQLEMACSGYRTQHSTITITDADVNMVLKLEPQPNGLAAPGGSSHAQAPQASQAAQPPTQKTTPRATQTVVTHHRTSKPAPRGASENRPPWPNPPAPEGGAFKQGLRRLKEDFRRAFW